MTEWDLRYFDEDGELQDVSEPFDTKSEAVAAAKKSALTTNYTASYMEVMEHTPVIRISRSTELVVTKLVK